MIFQIFYNYVLIFYKLHKAETLNYTNMCEILNKLEELYTNNLVYRTIIVCNNIEHYKNILTKNNYDVYILDKYNSTINYDKLDIRIFLIKKDIFINFINEYYKNIKNEYFYTSIIIDPIEELDSDLKREYKKISKNNTLIL